MAPPIVVLAAAGRRPPDAVLPLRPIPHTPGGGAALPSAVRSAR
jgi:hypothetical protein